MMTAKVSVFTKTCERWVWSARGGACPGYKMDGGKGEVGEGMVVVKSFLDLGVSKGVDLATVVISSTKGLNED